MDPRRLALLVAVVVLSLGGLFALLALEWRHDLGGFAENPQLLELTVGEKAIAGGRAVLAVESTTAAGATLTVSCRDVEERLELVTGMSSDEVCGLTLQLVALEPTTGEDRVVVRASW